MDGIECVVVGAGVVGVAVARALAEQGREVLLIEAERAPGTVTSARNSGVIHAGIYYKPGSLKAQCCVQGRDWLYAYAQARGVPHKRCGKLIVATDSSQVDALRALRRNAEANGVTDMRLLDGREAQALEPALRCVEALEVPATGLIDVHALIQSLLGDAESRGATLALGTRAVGGDVGEPGKLQLRCVSADGEEMLVACRLLVNAAGLGAQALALALRGYPVATVPPRVMAKGSYFGLRGKAPFARLVYPMPTPGSSGLHYLMDLGGQARFGPDVEWVDREDYTVSPDRLPIFEQAVRAYWPGLPEGALFPDYAGIRPKTGRNSPHDSDFVLHGSREHGIPGLVNLYGIESPGLTSCLALAARVAALLS